MRHQTTLRFIDAIARAGSIRRAAEDMAITPSALNRRLLAVEEELDVPLFERTAQGVRLSAAGELFLGHARRQMAELDRVRSQIEDMKGVRAGHVAFGFDRSLVPQGFGEALYRYRARHARVSFEVERISRDAIGAALSEYRIDLAGVVQPRPNPALTTLATAPLTVSAVLRQDHPAAERTFISFNQLLEYPLVLPSSGSLRHLLDIGAQRQDYDLRPVLECELAFAHHTLELTDAIGFALNTATRSETSLPGMVAVPVSTRDLPEPTLHLMQLRGRTLSVAAGRFADMLTQRFAQYSGEIPS